MAAGRVGDKADSAPGTEQRAFQRRPPAHTPEVQLQLGPAAFPPLLLCPQRLTQVQHLRTILPIDSHDLPLPVRDFCNLLFSACTGKLQRGRSLDK